MNRVERRLHRLQYEVRDWCRAVRDPRETRLTLHRESISGDPEVWGDG